MLDHYDIVADAGDQTGTMKAFDVTTPANGQVTIDFTHEVENPLVNGIEILRTDQAPPPPNGWTPCAAAPFDRHRRRADRRVHDASATSWSQVRGAFLVGSTLYYGYSDGNFYTRSFDGTTLGAASLVDPYNDPYWSNIPTGSGQTFRGAVPNLYGSEMQSVTGMVFSNGRLFYSLAGQREPALALLHPGERRGRVGRVHRRRQRRLLQHLRHVPVRRPAVTTPTTPPVTCTR